MSVSNSESDPDGPEDELYIETSKKSSKSAVQKTSKTRPCEKCKKKIRICNYDKHLETHKSTACNICGKEAKNAESLRGHMFYMHKSSAQQYKCEECNMFFRFKYRYSLHLQKTHGGTKTNICEVCGKAFFTVRQMNLHNQATHLKIKKYFCEYCDKGFTTIQARKAHIRQHTNERPFECNICDSTFRQKASLKKHLRSFHDLDDEDGDEEEEEEGEEEEEDDDEDSEETEQEQIPVMQPGPVQPQYYNVSTPNNMYYVPPAPQQPQQPSTSVSYFIPTGPPTYIYPTY